MVNEKVDPSLESLLAYLHQNRGFDFTGYKRMSLQRRIQKRLAMVAITDYSDYIDYLEVHPDEFLELFNTILINVTSFFRDQAAWDYLGAEIIPTIMARKQPGEPIRIWSAGCASGEEAYSLAILFAEAIGVDEFRKRIKIYATDVDEEALAQARHAHFSRESLENVGKKLREKYFTEDAGSFVFQHELRRQLIFGRHDLVKDAPISRLDLLVCRNTLMYLNADTQSKILSRLHFGVRDSGYLFLGKAEMLLTRTHLFLPAELTHRIFTKVLGVDERINPYIPPLPANPKSNSDLESQLELWQGALNASDLAVLIVDRKGTLIMANSAVRFMFGLDARDIGRPIQDLELSYRPIDLRSLIDRVYESKRQEKINRVERLLLGGGKAYLDITVVPLPLHSQVPQGAAISFDDVTRFQQMQDDLERINQSMETTNEELQSSNEELETTNEELQSTNEELETTNEELQSTNEELETMNEELQSTNEELETLNTELNQQSIAVNRSNNFLNAILASMEGAVIVVDPDIEVLSWNQSATEIWGLRSDEVIGKAFLSLDIGFPVEELKQPILNCLKGKDCQDTLSIKAINRRGKSIQCGVRISKLSAGEEDDLGVIILLDEGEYEYANG
jgi:two-component system, chemotaxis family, CheB/CheR fusion protein